MGHIVLHNDQPEKGRARYYALAWSCALGIRGWAIQRTWGPLRSPRRQQKTTIVEDQAEAQREVLGHLRRRLRHGYVVIDVDTAGQDLVAQQMEEGG
jgi:predicted DNA-binding WGR domain protein